MKTALITLLTFIGLHIVHATNDSPASILDDLDRCLEKSQEYSRQKEDRISRLKKQLAACPEAQITQQYDLTYRLYDEYQSFQYDSAYFYALQTLMKAEQLRDKDKIVISHCALAFCHMSAGLFLEAFDEMKMTDASDASNEAKSVYYALYHRLYYDAADYNSNDFWNRRYIDQGSLYADSLMNIVPVDSYEYSFAKAQNEIKHLEYAQCITSYQDILKKHDVSTHNKAIINSSIGGAYRITGQNDSAIVYLAKAAINDIESATKETTALYRLAEILCERNDNERSYRYIHAAMADIDFYNARHRKMSINPIIPIIEKARTEAAVRQRNNMMLIVGLCILSIIIFITAVVITKKQNRILRKKSIMLAEANRIKDEYIGHSFYVNSEFIAETEELYKTIHQKLAAHQYDDLRNISKLSNVNKRRDSMYQSFDKCFMRIFPSFVRTYAKLFPEGYIDPNATILTPEMRIFALIRLGITDSERISKILNYSVHTVYTYKTRVKTKSIVSNEEFERIIKTVEMA